MTHIAQRNDVTRNQVLGEHSNDDELNEIDTTTAASTRAMFEPLCDVDSNGEMIYTVSGVIEEAIARSRCGRLVGRVVGAGRTDTGVHALGQGTNSVDRLARFSLYSATTEVCFCLRDIRCARRLGPIDSWSRRRRADANDRRRVVWPAHQRAHEARDARKRSHSVVSANDKRLSRAAFVSRSHVLLSPRCADARAQLRRQSVDGSMSFDVVRDVVSLCFIDVDVEIAL